MFQEKDLANHTHRSPAMPPSVHIGKECACVFIRSRVPSLDNRVQKKPTRKACQPDIQESKRSNRTKKLHQKIFPKDPYLAKYEYFSITKATIEMMKVRSSSDAWTKPNFQP
jgi:hypothetical protein